MNFSDDAKKYKAAQTRFDALPKETQDEFKVARQLLTLACPGAGEKTAQQILFALIDLLDDTAKNRPGRGYLGRKRQK